MDRVILHIEQHLSDPLNARFLADLGNYSYYHFNRLFSEEKGEPLWHFVKRLRLERSAYLLSIQNYPLRILLNQPGMPPMHLFPKHFNHTSLQIQQATADC